MAEAEKEYIERGELIAETLRKIKENHRYRMAVVDYEFVDLVKDAPAADVVEVVHAEWEIVHGVFTPGGDPLKRCPYCKSEESEHIDGIEHPCHWKWCPVCGAKMDGGKNGKA